MARYRIGDLARLGGVSVRMLRHYHEIGLLEPVHVDPATGYRWYADDQLATLRRIVALRDLGCTLADVGRVFAGGDPADPGELRAVLERRRGELRSEADAVRRRLRLVDDELGALERPSRREPTTPLDVRVRTLPSRWVAQLGAIADSWAPTDIGPVIRPLYPELGERLARADLVVVGPSTAWFDDTDDGGIHVHATLGIDTASLGHDGAHARCGTVGVEYVELPAVATAVTAVHHGSMDRCDVTYEALFAWIDANGQRPTGYGREVDLVCAPSGDARDPAWQTEIQIPIEPVS